MSFELFCPGPNAEAVAAIMASHPKQPGSIYLSGVTGTGKTHLLHAACQRATEECRTSTMLSFRDVAEFGPQVLEGLEATSTVCLDDLHLVAGDLAWEQAVFILYNRCREAGSRLLVSGSMAPAGLGLVLQDLVSRLGWGLVFQLKPLADADKLLALQRRAATRGFDLTDDVGRYMLEHLPRDMAALMAALDKLDDVSLVRRRRLTTALVRDLFGKTESA